MRYTAVLLYIELFELYNVDRVSLIYYEYYKK